MDTPESPDMWSTSNFAAELVCLHVGVDIVPDGKMLVFKTLISPGSEFYRYRYQPMISQNIAVKVFFMLIYLSKSSLEH